VRAAGDIACQELIQKLKGGRPSDRYFKTVTKLGEQIADGGWKSFCDAEQNEILMAYEQD